MKTFDIISMGLRNLFKRKARTILTILGVLIGTAAIVVMMSLGVGMDEANMKAVESLGNVDIINVSSYYFPPLDESGNNNVEMIQGVLDDKAIATISAFEEVEAATPIMYEYFNFVAGKYKMSCSVLGIDVSVMDKFNFKVKEGRLLKEGDTTELIFGSLVPYNFYNTRGNTYNNYFYGMPDTSMEPPVNIFTDKIVMTSDWSYGEKKNPGMGDVNMPKPKLYKITGVGLLEGNENNYSEYDYSVIASINWLKNVKAEEARRNGNGGSSGRATVSIGGMNGNSQYDQAIVKVRDKRDVEAVQTKINDMGLGANSPLEYLKYMQQTTDKIQQLLGGIAAVSLLVAAIGIANTMVMSVYERTKEIAVMKVLGCKLRNIGQLFLFEAGMIGFFGGVVGIGFSYLVSFLLNNFGGNFLGEFGGFQFGGMMGDAPAVSVIPIWLILLGMIFATLIGLVSGFLPARRAMKLSVLQAIRNE